MTPSEANSCMLTIKFGWSISDITGRWSTPQETYKLRTRELERVAFIEADYPYSIVDTRVKVRGTGKVMLMHYESTDGKDFEMAGRVTSFTGETEG
jgi:hypothetical protein